MTSLRTIGTSERHALERKIAAISPGGWVTSCSWRWEEYEDYGSETDDEPELAFVTNRFLHNVYRLLKQEGYAARIELGYYESSWKDWGEGEMVVLTGIGVPSDVGDQPWRR